MKVLLTGATGFVGSHLYPALIAAGCQVRCATRDVPRARARHPQRDWVYVDVEQPATLNAALAGCDGAFYLIHGMGQGADYPEREALSARSFASAAAANEVGRIVYLGGVLPAGARASKHLASRRETGNQLRSDSSVSTIELRAAMIMGAGSASWTMVRDLAARLPAMVLPRWLRNYSHPIAIDDVVWALLTALHWPDCDSRIFEIPGPERISHRDVLRRVARLLGHTRPMVNVPVLTPRLSSYWIALVTRVNLELAKELVEGVRYDLDPQDDILWAHTSHSPMTIEEAARLAFADEGAASLPSSAALARTREVGRRFASTV